jgi:HNH endonuclease
MTRTERAMEVARKVTSYDPETGVISRRGKPVRLHTHKQGYQTFSCFYASLLVHRVAFLHMTGSVPREVDHINRDKADNRWCNLRAATRSQNAHNMGLFKSNKHGLKGVTYRPKYNPKNPWRSQITKNGKRHEIGSFATAEEASAAYARASKEKYGEFSPFHDGDHNTHSRPPT